MDTLSDASRLRFGGHLTNASQVSTPYSGDYTFDEIDDNDYGEE